MIRREFEGGVLLIPQTAHAWVSGQLALRWGNERFARPEPWDELMLVASQHDSGWAEWELAPRIHPDGRPVSFMEMELIGFATQDVSKVADQYLFAGRVV